MFGNYKWGIASFSGPGETFIANEGNEAKNVNNEIVENVMGREGADPNGEYDIWNDDTGGGNCWGANSANSTFAPGNGKVPLEPDLPGLPAGRNRIRGGEEHQPRAGAADRQPRRNRQPDDDPRLRRHQPAAEPAVHLGQTGRLAPGVPEVQAGRSGAEARRSDLLMRARDRRAPRAAQALKLIAVVVAAFALSGAVAAAANAPAAKKPKSKPKEVSVADFYFGPEKLTLKEGQSVNWVWAEANTYPHDVHLKSGPKSLKQKGTYSTKTTAVTDAEFEKTFTTPGTYKFICTIHPTEMHMTIVVKK